MEFFRNFARSIYSPKYYRELLDKPFSYSFKYFLKLALCVACIAAVLVSAWSFPRAGTFLNSLSDKLIAYYPDDLIVTIDHGQVSTNVPEPYFIPMPPELHHAPANSTINGMSADEFNKLQNLLVIDTVHEFSVDEFTGYHAFILLTKDSMVTYGKDGVIQIQKLDANFSSIINKSKVVSVVDRIRPWVPWVYLIIFIGAGVAVFFAIMFKLAYLLPAALLVWAIAKFTKHSFGYGKAYQMGLHLLTPVIIIQSLISAWGMFFWPVSVFPFFATAVFVIAAAINLKAQRDGASTVPPL